LLNIDPELSQGVLPCKQHVVQLVDIIVVKQVIQQWAPIPPCNRVINCVSKHPDVVLQVSIEQDNAFVHCIESLLGW
jgi:hypothetical protein